MNAGYWAFLELANFCLYGAPMTSQFAEPSTKYNVSVIHTTEE